MQRVLVSFHVQLLLPFAEAVETVVSVMCDLQVILPSTRTHEDEGKKYVVCLAAGKIQAVFDGQCSSIKITAFISEQIRPNVILVLYKLQFVIGRTKIFDYSF